MRQTASITVDLSGRPGEGLLVGLSGGLDSIVLLHVLATSPAVGARGLRALHVHHGLHADADAWADHCQRACDHLGVPMVVAHATVQRDSGEGPEAAARRARHAAFAAGLGSDEVLVLAHHRDDQAETFLLRALRASGPDGLGAMRPWRRFDQGWLWRPLLDLPRSALLAFARQQHLRWIEDPSNADSALDRNFLRHRVLPLLRERWPQADAAFARSAALSAEACDLLDQGDALALTAALGADAGTIEVDALLGLSAARRARVLRRWISDLALPALPSEGVAHIELDLLHAAADAEAQFAWSGAVVRRWRGLLHADVAHIPLPSTWQAAWDGASPLALPAGGTLVLQGAQGFDAPVRVHARQGGERITLPGRGHSHALKHVLQELGIPPWTREAMPLLSGDDGELLAAGDIAFSARFDAWLQGRGASLVWTR